MRAAGRLRQRREFQSVYTEGVKVVGRHLVVFARPGRCDVPRLGVTATRRMGGAVMRNRARRRVRELFRLNGEALAGTAVDIVVNVRRSCCGAPWAELEGDYLECLTKAARRLRQRAS